MEHESLLQEPRFWVAVAFVLFVAVFGKKLWRALMNALDARSRRIQSELEEAARLRAEAEEILADYQRKSRESIQEAQGIMARAREDAARLAATAERELKTALDARMKLAVDKIAQAEKQAIAEVQNHIADITVTAARSLIAERLQKISGEDFVRMAIADLERKVH